MTHFTAGIIVPPRIRNIEAYIARQMAPYDENREAARTSIDHLSDRWDWYRIGGRWDGWITGNPPSDDGFNFDKKHETVENNIATTESALAADKIPHAIITPDGEWHERGEMGWFAVMANERDDWDEDARDILRKHPGHRIVIVDAHI